MALTILYPIRDINNRISSTMLSLLRDCTTKRSFAYFELLEMWYVLNLDRTNSVLFSAEYQSLSYTYPTETSLLLKSTAQREVGALYRMVKLPPSIYPHEVNIVTVSGDTLSLYFPTANKPQNWSL